MTYELRFFLWLFTKKQILMLKPTINCDIKYFITDCKIIPFIQNNGNIRNIN